ncbi:AAA family ATPase [Streptomyces sp. O3]
MQIAKASEVRLKRMNWLHKNWLPKGALTLLAGREGLGKSAIAYQYAADVSRGLLEGDFKGQPRNVIVVATEDSWSYTIAPRLMGAGADMERILYVHDGEDRQILFDLSQEADRQQLACAIMESNAALVIFDPLISRLGHLDSHKDSEVRQALEPVTEIAERTGSAILGLIHVNKGGGDALNRVMGSRAFAAVARAVLYVMTDPDDDNARLLGQAKSNLGPTPSTKRFRIATTTVDKAQRITTARVEWLGDTDRTIGEALYDADVPKRVRPRDKAVKFLREQLEEADSGKTYKELQEAADDAGIAKNTLYRARDKAGVIVLKGRWLLR